MKYIIKKNRHFGWHWFKLFFKKESILKHDVTFTQSCLYKFGDVDDFDINKLFGRSFGMHHKNSVRFGWRPDKNKIVIYSYTYRNSVREYKELTTCDVGKSYTFQITCKDDLALMQVSCSSYKIRYGATLEKGGNFGYKLYPFFGGNKAAPHDVTIFVD